MTLYAAPYNITPPFLPCSYHSLQGSSDKRMAELHGELKVLRFEKERTGLLYQETARDLKRLQLEQEKHQKKVSFRTLPGLVLYSMMVS